MLITKDYNIYHMPCGDLCATSCLPEAEEMPTTEVRYMPILYDCTLPVPFQYSAVLYQYSTSTLHFTSSTLPALYQYSAVFYEYCTSTLPVLHQCSTSTLTTSTLQGTLPVLYQYSYLFHALTLL